MRAIWAVALYEMRHLVRDWFFRIFVIVSIIPIITMTIVFFSSVSPVPWLFRAIPSFPPLANLTMLNIAQTAIFVLLAADIFKRERKTNTVEVIHIRPLANMTYLSGKALGIMLLFLIYDLVVLTFTFIVQAGFSDIDILVMPYFYYLLLIPIPSMIFTIGLTFLLMRIVRNQALAALIIIGIEAVVLIYLRTKFHSAFDFVGTYQPMVFSQLSGFSNLTLLLMQRAAFLLAGLASFLVAVRFFFRLPQSKFWQRMLWPCVLLTAAGAAFCAYSYTHHFTTVTEMRREFKAAAKKYAHLQPAGFTDCALSITHQGEQIQGEAVFSGPDIEAVDTLAFSLNPGLIVDRVLVDGKVENFERNRQVILVPGGQSADSIKITYHGIIDDRIAYPDVTDEELFDQDFMWLYHPGKQYSIVQDDYVLLTPEVQWYPIPGVRREGRPLDSFINYTLQIQTAPDLMAISQGQVTDNGDGRFSFHPEQPLTGLSLVIGDYDHFHIQADSVEYSVYSIGKSELFQTSLPEITDTLSVLIKGLREDYERKINLQYPFRRLALVEVPIHFYAYRRMWSAATDWVQPEQVWLPENGASLAAYDFKRMDERFNRRFESRNQTYTDKEIQTLIFERFIKNTLLSYKGFPNEYPDGLVTYKGDHSLFGNYYSHVIRLHSVERSVFAAALEGYLYERSIEQEQNRPWRNEGLSRTEKVSKALSAQSMSAIIDSSDDRELKTDVIRLKGEYLFKTISRAVGEEAFESFWSRFVKEHRFKKVMVSEWIDALEKKFDVDLRTFLDIWYAGESLPGFRTEKLEMYQVMDGDRLRYQVRFEIYNPENIDGLFEVQFSAGGGFRRMGRPRASEDEPPRVYQLAAHQRKRIGIILNDEPRRVTINSLIARNIPIVNSQRFAKSELRAKAAPFEGESIIPFESTNSRFSELIIDNADTAFSTSKIGYSSWLKELIYSGKESEQQEFDNFRFWQPPNHWRLVKDAGYYGVYVHSAYYIRPGNGDKFAQWRAHLPDKGMYDVYTYMFDRRRFQRRRNRGSIFNDFHYTIQHDDGVDEVEIDVNKSESGWAFLGTYYFSKDSAVVRLSNRSTGRVVVADAVRFVKH